MEENNKLLIQCDCSGEMLLVTAESETFNDDKQYRLEFALAIYSHGTYREKPTLWWRIKYALRHIWTGKIYEDYMIIDEHKAERLAKFIKENIEKRRPSIL